MSNKQTILEEAIEITSNDRNREYGEPVDNHRRVARLWNVYLSEVIEKRFHLVCPDDILTEEDVCILNVLQKVGRWINMAKRDNLVDIAGWARNIEMIEDARLGNLDDVPF